MGTSWQVTALCDLNEWQTGLGVHSRLLVASIEWLNVLSLHSRLVIPMVASTEQLVGLLEHS